MVGTAEKKKHENRASDFCGSIAVYWTGKAAGINGPATFVIKGNKQKSGYTDKLLARDGCEEGFTVAITENTYATEEEWR